MTDYFIDFTNGNDARSGLKIGNNTIDSTASTVLFVDAALTGADDYITGSYFYNVTRGLGSLITAFVAATDTVTLGTVITGMAAGDTYYILDAWLTLGKYTTTTVRTAGDIAYIRAGTTQSYTTGNIEFDEAGTQAARISIIGCDASVNDPWHDASNTLPIFSFGNSAYFMNLDTAYWVIKRLSVKDSTKTNAGLIQITATGCQVSYCNISDITNLGITVGAANIVVYIDNTTFSNNVAYSIQISSYCHVIIDNCTFNGGAETTDIGIMMITTGSIVYVSNSTFGSTTAHDVDDIKINAGGRVYCRNCTFNKTTLNAATMCGEIHSEDHDGVFGAQVSYYLTGTVTKSATVRDGGGTSSAQMMPSSSCGAILPLCINNLSPIAQDLAIWNTSTSPVNVDIYIRADSAWGTYPTNAQLYTEASYLTSASTAARATVVSTDVIADGTTWVRFRTTMTPARAGWIYMKVYLKLYAAGEGVIVDIKPVIS